ncbi:MAG: glycosyltransferase family 25 protein [Alphaproteobacteria bacterium]|nr:glycosyltransferase family 25 protein [Alphaproteobacteria bacterium]
MSGPGIPVFVISLSGETSRRESVKTQLGRLGIPFEFFDAVDGRGMDVKTHPAYDGPRRIRCFGKHLTGGELGCLLSHKALYETILENNLDLALILEDDVILEDDFKIVLEDARNKTDRFDILRFLGSPKVMNRAHRDVFSMAGIYRAVRMPTAPGGAHAYLITHRGARIMLQHLQKNPFPIDTLIGRTWQTGLEVLAVKPGLAKQNLDFISAIETDRFDKKINLPPLKKAIFLLTRGLFKISEAAGKRFIYWSRFYGPRNLVK